MNTNDIANFCRAEIKRLSAVLAALDGARPKMRRSKGKRTMSAAARKRISRAQKARWKEQRAKAKA